MKRYYVIKKLSANNGHLNEQDMLPASCKQITGIAVCTIVKKESDAVDSTEALAFPLGLIKRLLASERVVGLFYSYMKTRQTEAESKAFFESDMLPDIVASLCNGIIYPCLTEPQQNDFKSKLSELLTGGSDQPEINWEQRFTELKTEFKNRFFSFITDSYGGLGINPESDLTYTYVDMLFSYPSRSYGLYRISVELYYALRDNGHSESYSTISRNVNTYGNSIMQDYDLRFSQLTNEKLAYEEAETKGLAHYLYATVGIFEKGKGMKSSAYTELVAKETLSFLKHNKDGIFIKPIKKYLRPEPYDCGSISLLVNGNSFLLRDFMLTANRKIKHLSKEIIPFSEPLDVNSSLQTVFKSNMKSGAEPLNIRIYIQYEDYKEHKTEKQEATA